MLQMRTFSMMCAAVAAAALLGARPEPALAEGAASGAAALGLRCISGEAAVHSLVEIDVEWPEGTAPAGNAFDPDEVSVGAVVSAPGGRRLELAGFLFQDYDRRLEGGREVLSPRGDPRWRVRYAPASAGRHVVEVEAKAAGGSAGRGRISLDVKEGKSRGFARVDAASRRYFRLDDGTPLFLSGFCCCWHGGRGTYDYDDWLPAAARAGMNYIRIWMWPHAFGIEWDAGDRLRYRLDRAWTVDRVLSEAQRLGIYVMLCLDYHGMFEVKTDYFGGNNYWPRHPYNRDHGGPCATQNDFFTSPEAAELYRKRLRYMVARWGSFTSLFAWQFFNEIDNEYKYLKHEDVVEWHRRMGRHLRSIDPYDHLISTSLTGSSERPDFWKLPEMDFAQFHSYNAKQPADMTADVSRRFHECYGKPVYVGEYGTDWKGWKPDQDPYFRALHQAVWSGPMTGAAGTAMSWWWESIHAANLYSHWSALAAFLEGTAIARSDMAPARIECVAEPKLKTFGVAGRGEAFCWFLDPAYNWPAGGTEEEPKLHPGSKVSLKGLQGGTYAAEWWDTLEGKVIRRQSIEVSGESVEIEVPAFRIDIGLRLKLGEKGEAAK